jgi:hypothetical protein
MYNCILLRVAHLPIFCILFVSGLCTGSLISIFLTFMDHSIGIFGAAFLSLLAGFCSGSVGLIYTSIFNTLAPSLGGIPLKIETIPIEKNDKIIIEPPDLPFY